MKRIYIERKREQNKPIENFDTLKETELRVVYPDNTLALDIATKCGYYCKQESGTINFEKWMKEYFKTHDFLMDTLQRRKASAIKKWLSDFLDAHEEIEYLLIEDLIQVDYRGDIAFRTLWYMHEAVKQVAEEYGVSLIYFHIGDIKKHLTGSYTAKKDVMIDRKSTRLNSSHRSLPRMPSSA